MKANATNPQKTTKARTYTAMRPENKNILDSREGEEQITKGDDVTHNRKEVQSEGKKKHK